MTTPLAVFTPLMNVRSETFISRHIESLLPNETSVITRDVAQGEAMVNDKILFLSRLPQPRFRKVLVRAFYEKVKWRYTDPDVKAVQRFLSENRVRVALGEYLDFSLPWMGICQDMGIKFFAHAHGYDVSQSLHDEVWRTEYRRYRQSAGVITVNQEQRARLITLGLDADRIHVIPCGVDVPPLLPAIRRPDGLIRCLVVGRMVPKKGPILCLDAFRRAAEVIPSLRLAYIGDGELFSSARHFVQTLGLEDKVTLLGAQPSEVVHEFMMTSDIFIQHSIVDPETGDKEGLPVAILEAMAGGLPVVATRHAGIPEAVNHEVTGLLVDEGDSAGMAQNIIQLCRDEAWRRLMGQAGWERAREKFSWDGERAALLSVMGLSNQGSGMVHA